MSESQNIEHKMNAPTYTISTKSIDLVAKIAEKVGELKGSGEFFCFCHHSVGMQSSVETTKYPPLITFRRNVTDEISK